MSAPLLSAPRNSCTHRISAKQLGELALPDCCERCFWLKFRTRHRLPYQIFPGVFASIDSFVKNAVHGHFDAHGRPPTWLAALGDIVGYIEPPHWRQFQAAIPEHDTLITGVADALFIRRDTRLVIADYKTARITGVQDALLPMYTAQLNAYAEIAERSDLGSVAELALIYLEPMLEGDDVERADGLRLPLNAHVVRIEHRPAMLSQVLERARRIAELDAAPAAQPGCRECPRVNALVSYVGSVDGLPGKPGITRRAHGETAETR